MHLSVWKSLRSVCVLLLVVWIEQASGTEPGLIGHWKLQGDCRDYSGHENHGINHRVDLQTGLFNGTSAYIEVPSNKTLELGTGDFTFCARVYTEKQLDDVVGDILDKYDPDARRGVTLSINSTAGGLQSQGTDRHVYFGIDNAQLSDWQDCGRPSPASNYVSLSMTVYKGKLYAGTTGGEEESDWRHVYCYGGGAKWIDCGQVGDERAQGVGPLIVHNGDLYAGTWTVDWTRVRDGGYAPGRVYRYLGGKQWEDCGQPSNCRTLNCIASFGGKLFVGGGPETYGVFTQTDGKQWKPSTIFPKTGPERCFPHSMAVFNGKLFTGYPVAYAYDGNEWKYAGKPFDYDLSRLQLYCFVPHQGKLCVGSWPEGKVAQYEGGEAWRPMGRVGEDGTEVNGLVVYNGKLYGGTMPRAEVCRYDGETKWTSLKRFYSPDGWKPGIPYHANRKEVNEWVRLTSLTIHNGRLFASTASCTSSVKDAPIDIRGKVFSMEAGKCVSYDDDIGPGWKHLIAMREGGRLKLFVDGKLVAESSSFDPARYDLSNGRPLRIGFGQVDYFAGRMADVRLYNRALTHDDIQALTTKKGERASARSATIKLADNPSGVDQFAAAELKKYLAAALGWEVKTVGDKNASSDEPVFYVGTVESGIARAPGLDGIPEARINALAENGVYLKGDGNSVVLAGKGTQGALFAVYEFLEKFVGVHWPEPGREYVPRLSSLDLHFEHIHKPTFVYRGLSLVGGSCTDDEFNQITDWEAKNRLNSLQLSCETYDRLRPKIIDSLLDRGTQLKVGGHSRKYFYPSNKYFAEYPEHFALVKGKRTGDTQLCYSNHQSAGQYAENVIVYLRAHPEITAVGLWPSDGYGFCECDKCKSLPTTDVLLDYTNDVAGRIHSQLPQVKVEFLSYIHYTSPPQRVRPLPCVIPTYCEYWSRSQFHPITDERASNAKCRQQLEQWVKVSPQATVYSYYADDVMKRFLYNPIPGVVRSDLQYYRNVGLAGSTVLNMYPHSWWANGPHLFAYAKAAWDADSDSQHADDDYLFSLYGTAAAPMREHQNAVRSLFEAQFPNGQTGEEMLFGFRIDKFNIAKEASSKAEFNEAVTRIRNKLADARLHTKDSWIEARLNTLDEDAQLMSLIYGVLDESAGFAYDKEDARKSRMREIVSRLEENDVVTKEDFRCRILNSLMPHLVAVLGASEAARYERRAYLPIE